jgi:RNA polymerase sigma-70 factor (ECF subfamily)
MPPPPADEFDALTTSWTLLRDAHNPQARPERRSEALDQLFRRYQPLARRYLGGALRREKDREEAVNECFQRFCLKLLEGRLQGADPNRGSFRRYLRTLLSNLVTDYQRERQRQLPGLPEAAADVPEAEFREWCREDLVRLALVALEREEQQTGRVLYSVLKLKMDHPDWRAPQLAEHLAGRLKQALSAVWVRQRLFQARKRLCQLLREQVRLDLPEPTDQLVEEELARLGLLDYLRPDGER